MRCGLGEVYGYACGFLSSKCSIVEVCLSPLSSRLPAGPVSSLGRPNPLTPQQRAAVEQGRAVTQVLVNAFCLEYQRRSHKLRCAPLNTVDGGARRSIPPIRCPWCCRADSKYVPSTALTGCTFSGSPKYQKKFQSNSSTSLAAVDRYLASYLCRYLTCLA